VVGGPPVVRRPFREKVHCRNCIRHETNEEHTHTSVLILSVLVDLQQEVGELVSSCPSTIIL
jgi:hypothetical protein